MKVKKATDLKTFRKSLKLNQTEFAHMLSISASTISGIETGRIAISKKVKIKIKNTFKDLYKQDQVANLEKIQLNNSKGRHDFTESKWMNNDLIKIGHSIDNHIFKVLDETSFSKDTFHCFKKSCEIKAKYNELFFKELSEEDWQLNDVYKTLKLILDFKYTLENLEYSYFGYIIQLFETDSESQNFSTILPDYKLYKRLRKVELSRLLPFTETLKKFSDSIKIFIEQMDSHAKSIKCENSKTKKRGGIYFCTVKLKQ